MKTDREVYEFIANALMEQGLKSQIKRQTTQNIPLVDCAYRGENNTRCAVGQIISDEFYSELFEGKSIHEDEVLEAVQQSNPEWDVDYTSFLMLNQLQLIHDSHQPEDWEELFNKSYNFTSSEKWSK